MKNLNKLKSELKNYLIEDKLEITKSTAINLKSDLYEVFKRYTNLDESGININIKILSSNKYLLEVVVIANDLF